MVAIRNIFALFAVFSFSFCASVAEIYADTHTAASPSYSDVSAAVSAASSGDTIDVPAGSATWSSSLSITKGLTLQGAGVGNTVITGNVGNNAFVVSYIPANPSLNEPFRLTGFTFNLNSNSLALRVQNLSTAYPISKIRIDHNSFLNCLVGGSNYAGFWIYGTVYGVFDSNTLTGAPHMDIFGMGLQAWNNLTFTYGTADAWFIEDNTFTTNTAASSGQEGGRYVARYNTWTYINGTQDLSPWYDVHGDYGTAGGCVYYGTMGVEIYGNSLTLGSTVSGVKMFHHRGGMGLFFFNKIVNASTNYALIRDEEETSDSYCPTTNPQPSHVSDSYYWNNRNGNNLATYDIVNDTRVPPLEHRIAADADFWIHKVPFDGTSGCGCGTLANRPANCIVGVGYWATDQDCSQVAAANVGAHPTTPINGTLYKYTATNVWTAYYTPYTYPHPLRREGVPVPDPPTGLKIID